MIVKSIVIFAFVLQIVPDHPAGSSASCSAASSRGSDPTGWAPRACMQPLADVFKLLSKEPSTPDTAVPWMMAIAPVISIVTAVATLAIIPFGPFNAWGGDFGLYGIDVSIGLLYFFAFGSLGFYGLMLGGWASGSKYSFLGAMRAAAQLISYEVALGLSLLGVAMTAGSLSLVDIVEAQDEHVVRRAPVRGLLHLHGGRLRRDRPRAVRPARGRRRDRGRLQHRVRRHALRLVLHGRVHRGDRDLRDRGRLLPRRLARTGAGGARAALDAPEADGGRRCSSSGSARRCRACATTS